jgi:hypothetical protein
MNDQTISRKVVHIDMDAFYASVEQRDELTTITLALRERVELVPQQLFRLVGVGLSNFQLDVESPLFEDGDAVLNAKIAPVSSLATK